jgi:hypothetical protein
MNSDDKDSAKTSLDIEVIKNIIRKLEDNSTYVATKEDILHLKNFVKLCVESKS